MFIYFIYSLLASLAKEVASIGPICQCAWTETGGRFLGEYQEEIPDSYL